MPYKKYPLLDKKKTKTISIENRKSAVDVNDFAQPYEPGSDFNAFLKSLPHSHAVKDFVEFAHHLKEARKKEKPIILGMGEDIIKSGLNPIVIDLMERGWISAISVNGTFMINDFEIALRGKTVEDSVDTSDKKSFGNTEETGLFLNVALREGYTHNLGAGEAVGHYLISSSFPYNKTSIFYKAYKLNIPVIVHSTIGTDFIHYHPGFDGATLGALAEIDFLLFSSVVSQLGDGGIYINCGSAFTLPEAFLKAVSFCSAQGIGLKNFFTAVFDTAQPGISTEKIISDSLLNGGKGYYFTGHYEIMIPLLAAVLLNL